MIQNERFAGTEYGEEPMTEHTSLQRIVIVGGGAGGLELATRLDHRLGRRNCAQVTLIKARQQSLPW
jgi:pyruvate/2-oxoglutarate dehydrogenase complex dihydrolipoamide dehydrogenase (E3) component